jgi:hypothetical protein
VNHRIFERTLHPLAFRGAHPFECREILKTLFLDWGKGFGLGGLMLALTFEGKLLSNKLVRFALLILDGDKTSLRFGFGDCSLLLTVLWTMMGVSVTTLYRWEAGPTKRTLTSNRVRLPAELKHINKRRKRN